MQMKMPRFQLAHLGSVMSHVVSLSYHSHDSCTFSNSAKNVRLFFLQSAQLLLPSNLTRLFKVDWFWAVLSGPALIRRDMIGAAKIKDLI